MLPSANHLARRHGAFCLKYRVTWRECSEALAGALSIASELAGDRTEDEPAALLYALTLRPRALGDAWLAFPIVEARRLARDAGRHLDLQVDDVELENLRLGALDPRTGIGFDEIRDFVAARTRAAFLRSVKYAGEPCSRGPRDRPSPTAKARLTSGRAWQTHPFASST